jgi:hypothetical protein
MNRIWIGTLVAALVATAVVVVIATRVSATSLSPPARVTVYTSFEQPVVGFGDRVHARAVVMLDAKTDRDARVTVNVAPLAQLGHVHVTRVTRGRLITLTYDVAASCMFEECIGRGGRKLVKLAPVRVDLPGRAGFDTPWPPLDVRGRVVAADLQPTQPPLRFDVTPPPVDYRVAPSALATLLTVLAAIFAIAGVGLAGWQFAVLRRERAAWAEPLTELERALAMAREAESRSAPDRRRALALLERLLRPRDARLAREARDLAWSSPPPGPEELDDLVSEVESKVGR